MATKKKAAAKKAPAKKKAAGPKRYVQRPVTYEVTAVEHAMPDSTLARFGAHKVLAAQTGEFVGVDVPGHGRARPGDVILSGDDGSISVCSQLTFEARYVELDK